MIGIRDLCIKYLLADTTIAGMVDTRIYPPPLPEKAKKSNLAMLMVTMVSNTPIANLRSAASAADPRLQIDAYAPTRQEADELNGAVRRIMERFVGNWTDNRSPETSCFVQVEFITDEDLFEEDIVAGTPRRMSQYFVFHSRYTGML